MISGGVLVLNASRYMGALFCHRIHLCLPLPMRSWLVTDAYARAGGGLPGTSDLSEVEAALQQQVRLSMEGTTAMTWPAACLAVHWKDTP